MMNNQHEIRKFSTVFMFSTVIVACFVENVRLEESFPQALRGDEMNFQKLHIAALIKSNS